MAGAMGAMNSLLGKLPTLLGEEYAKHKKLQKDVRFLKDELSSMKGALQKYSEMQNPDVQVKTWVKEVRELAYDIEDCIDAFIVRVEHMPYEPAGIKGLFKKSIDEVKKLMRRHNMADEIQELMERALEVKDRRERYRLDDSMSMPSVVAMSMPSVVAIDLRLPLLYAEASGLVGMDGPRDEIIRWLTEEGEGIVVKKLKVVSIVGFGGLGKTTLAKQVYDTIKGQFDCTAFVTVSQSPDVKKILADMLSQVGHRGGIMDDDKQLIDELREYLKNKRYLIIVDDIWSIPAWDTMKSALLENNVGSRVITTTRNIGIPRSCCLCLDGRVYNIQPLSEHDSRKLFLKRIFHSECCPPHLEEISNAILRKCGGVPLAILCISSLLAGKPDTKDDWEQVRNSIGSELETNPTLEGMKKILLLSYYDLPHYLKTCLLYLSMFPEDFLIERNELVWMWIAEGFIVAERGKRLDLVGEGYFNDLINRSMIQPVSIQYDGKAQYCRVHDLVLNIIKSLSIEENFVMVLNGDNCSSLSDHVRRLSLQYDNLGEAAMQTIIKSPSHVRTLTAFSLAKQIPNLLNFRSLRVLDFSNSWEFDELQHIECIGNLFQIRYLNLGWMEVSELPNHIGNLQYLEVLHIRNGRRITFPETIGGLQRLVRLHVADCLILTDEIGNMHALEELSCITVPSQPIKFFEGLSRLTKLRELEMRVYKMPNDGGRYMETLANCLQELGRHKLESLRITHYGTNQCIVDSLIASDGDLPRLRKLCIDMDGYGDKQFPKCIGMLASLVHLELRNFGMANRDLHVLRDISTLQFLKLQLLPAQNERVVVGSQGFQCLKELQFCAGINEMWLQFSAGAMPKLQRLGLGFSSMQTYDRYGDCDFGIEYLSDLRHVWVDPTLTIYERTYGDYREFAWAAIRKACTIHPNRPTLELDREWR